MTDPAAAPLPVFVYGLLRPGRAGYRELDLAAVTEWIGDDALAGTLYDLGDYPGAILGGGGTIRGEILMPRAEDVLARLDAYELYDRTDPRGSEYVRVRGTTFRRGLNVWVYAYNRPPGDRPIVPGGEWPA